MPSDCVPTRRRVLYFAVIDYPTMQAAFASGGIALPVCEPDNPCTPGPGSMNFVADNTYAACPWEITMALPPTSCPLRQSQVF